MRRECAWRTCAQWSVVAVAGLSIWASRASAQEEEIPDSVAADVAGSKTEAAGEATFTAPPPDIKAAEQEAEAAKEEPKAEVDWSLNAGGAINTGNTRSWNINAGTNFLLSKNEHRLTIASMFNYGRAAPPPTTTGPATDYATVAKQFFFNSRYDYFFTDMDAVWASLGYRWDPLAGFTAQLMASAGYLRAFIKTEKHYFAGRIGYSYTYENYEVPPATLTDNSNIHGLLAALDYENKLNEHVQFLSSIVTIYNLNEIEVQNAQPFEDIRIYLTAALLSKVTDKLAFEARFLMLYDRLPAGPALVKTDTTTIFSLVYTLL